MIASIPSPSSNMLFGRIHGVRVDGAVDQVVAAWAGDVGNGLKSLIVVDTSQQAAEISARCQQHRLATGELGEVVGYGRRSGSATAASSRRSRRSSANRRPTCW